MSKIGVFICHCGENIARTVDTELVAKAALLGIALIASRTSPTAMAVKMADAAGITLIGYVKVDRFEVYCHPDRLELPAAA